MFKLHQNSKATDQPTSTQKDLSLLPSPFCNTRRAQNPNQPRLLSTSCISWHNMSKAVWVPKATFATSQSWRKRATVSPDPCGPMTNSASLPTLFPPDLLDETEEPLSDRQEVSSAIMCKPIKAHAFTLSAEMLGPNRTSSLKTLGSSFKRKKKSSPYGPYIHGTFHCVEAVRRRTLSHASRKGHRTSSQHGRIRPDLLPQPQVIAAVLPQEPRTSLSTDLPRTLRLCPAQQLDL